MQQAVVDVDKTMHPNGLLLYVVLLSDLYLVIHATQNRESQLSKYTDESLSRELTDVDPLPRIAADVPPPPAWQGPRLRKYAS